MFNSISNDNQKLSEGELKEMELEKTNSKLLTKRKSTLRDDEMERGAYTSLKDNIFEGALKVENINENNTVASTSITGTRVKKKAKISTVNKSSVSPIQLQNKTSDMAMAGENFRNTNQFTNIENTNIGGSLNINQPIQQFFLQTSVSNEQIVLLKKFLKKAYENHTEIKKMFGKSLQLEGQYVNLQMLYYLNLKDVKVKEGLTSEKYKESRPSSFEDLFADKRSIKPEDLFKPNKHLFPEKLLHDIQKTDDIPHFLLVQGRAGIGKTTFVRYITREWACGRLYQEYQWVFTLFLKELQNVEFKNFFEQGKSLSLWEYIYHAQFITQSLKKEEFNVFWQQQIEPAISQGEVLLILDGYDELPEKHPCQKILDSLMKGEYANIPKIITSRSYEIHQFPTNRRNLEIIGFIDENIQQYITAYFRDKSSEIPKLVDFLQKNPALWATCHVPLHLNLICALVEPNVRNSFSEINIHELGTMTGLYAAIERRLLEYCYKERLSLDAEPLPLFQNSRNQFLLQKHALERQFLAELAFNGIRDNQPTLLSGEMIEALLYQYKIAPENQQSFMKNLVDLGLIKPAIEDYKEGQDYEFLHSTFQEYYAALHMAFLLQDTQRRMAIEEHILIQKFNPYWQIVWWFVAGLVKSDEEAFSYFLKLLQDTNTQDVLGHYALGLLVRVVDESYGSITNLLLDPILSRVQRAFVTCFDRYQKGQIYLFEGFPPFVRMLQLSPTLLKLEGKKDIMDDLPWKEQSLNIIQDILEFLGIVKVVTPSALEYVHEKLLDNNRLISKKAAYTIRQMGALAATPKILKTLSVLLMDNEEDIRQLAISAIKGMRASAATAEIFKAFNTLLISENEEAQLSVLSAIKRIGAAAATPEFLETLGGLLKDKAKVFQKPAISAIKGMGAAAATPKFLKTLGILLKDKEEDVRGIAANAVDGIGAAAATPEFLETLGLLLKNKNEDIRRNAVDAVKGLGAAAATPEFLKTLGILLKNKDESIRTSAADAIGGIGIAAATPKFLQTLSILLKNKNKAIRVNVTYAIGEIGAAAVTPEFLKALGILLKDKEEDVRATAASVTGRIGAAAATSDILDALYNLLKKKNCIARAAYAIKEIGPTAATPDILRTLRILITDEEYSRIPAAYAIGGIGERAITPDILEQLNVLLIDKEKDGRSCAVHVIGKIGGAAVTPKLLEVLGILLAKKEKVSREDAVCIIKEIGSRVATAEFLKTLGNLLGDKEESIRKSAVAAVGGIGATAATPEFLETLGILLGNKDEGVRMSAAYAVEKIGSAAATPEFLKMLESLFADKEKGIRESAIFVIGKIGVGNSGSKFLKILGNFLTPDPDIDTDGNILYETFTCLRALARYNFTSLYQIWCSLSWAEDKDILMEVIPCLIAITVGGYLANNVQLQIFWKENSYQCLIYMGTKFFENRITIQQAQIIRHLVSSIITMFEVLSFINIEELKKEAKKLPEPLDDPKMPELKILSRRSFYQDKPPLIFSSYYSENSYSKESTKNQSENAQQEEKDLSNEGLWHCQIV